MMTLVLYRTYHEAGTNGVLYHGGERICETIELPWRNNKRGISCIPPGRYRLQRHHYPRHGDQLGLPNVPNREAILIHPANSALDELRGCIAPVTKCTEPGKGLYSRVAVDRLKSRVYPMLDYDEPVWLVITDAHLEPGFSPEGGDEG